MKESDPDGAIAFAEKVLELIDEGRFTATYKFAVLLGMIDLCLEQTEHSGAPPELLTTRQLAEKWVEMYWPHTLPFARMAVAAVLKQNTSGQAEVVSEIMRFRERHACDPSVPHWESRINAPEAYERLVRRIEWKLIEMPLPRLQIMGQSYRPFIYEIGWDQQVNARDVRRYQSGTPLSFDNRILLKARVGEYLLQLSGLLRPLIQRRWAARVAQLNRLEETQLEMFLFGVSRIPTTTVRTGLWEIQSRRCFYCDARIVQANRGVVDHFIPWSRYADDSIDNLVVADQRCNAFKSNSLAAAPHLERWARRLTETSSEWSQLDVLAKQATWDRQSDASRNVARGIYFRLPADARLWFRKHEFVAPDFQTIRNVL